MSTATSLVRAVLAGAAAHGVEAAPLLARSGLDARTVEDRDARVSTSAFLDIFAAAAEASREPAFGGEVARTFDAACFGLLGFVIASCATLGEALARFRRHVHLICDELSVDVVPRGDEVAITYALHGVPELPLLFEMALTHLVETARAGTRGRFQPRRVVFRHASLAPTLLGTFGADVVLGGAENAVICDSYALDLPLRGSNRALLGVLEDHVALVARAPASSAENEVTRTRDAIRALLPDGHPSLAQVARRLGLGARTLQRRLRDRGIGFRALVDDVRRESAIRRLRDPEVSVTEVAFALGFSGPSAFHHAFRRWTGRSPSARC
jgi:AraC-like DNA-binding protein